jgi:hypothetical protein
MRRLILIGALGALTACTPSQMAAFQQWHEADPAGSEAWLNTPEGQATLDDVDPPHVVHVTSNPKWDAIAQCESGGNWSHPPVTNSTGTYSGGLMIRNNVWRAYGGQQFAPLAYQATRAEQIVVGERIRADVGWSAWDCS